MALLSRDKFKPNIIKLHHFMYIGLPPANSDVETSFLCTAGVTAKLFNFCQLKKNALSSKTFTTRINYLHPK